MDLLYQFPVGYFTYWAMKKLRKQILNSVAMLKAPVHFKLFKNDININKIILNWWICSFIFW